MKIYKDKCSVCGKMVKSCIPSNRLKEYNCATLCSVSCGKKGKKVKKDDA